MLISKQLFGKPTDNFFSNFLLIESARIRSANKKCNNSNEVMLSYLLKKKFWLKVSDRVYTPYR